MCILSWLFGCFAREDNSLRTSLSPEMKLAGTSSHQRNSTETGRFLASNSDYIRPASPILKKGHGHQTADDNGDKTVVPLPHNLRPMITHKQCLETQPLGPLMSSEATVPFHQEGKFCRLYDDEMTSDDSSAISFPSTYGDTSTATTESLPPPYSPNPYLGLF
jgi:hypothetical protein